MRAIFCLLSLPLHVSGNVLIFFNVFGLRDKLETCIAIVDDHYDSVPEAYFSYLVAAEDHRSEFHYGIDPIGVLRACYVRVTENKVQGASTIEQQFVRVVTDDYRYVLTRKFKEQVLAIALGKVRKKSHIGRAYLAIAYYGFDYKGLEGIIKLVGKSLSMASKDQIVSVVARIKYPEPSCAISEWHEKHNRRVNYIVRRHEEAVNKSRQWMLRTAA